MSGDDRCPACGAALDAPRAQTDAERAHEIAEDLRRRGQVVTDAEVEALLTAASEAL